MGRTVDPTLDLMNWTCVVYGGPMLFALIWFLIDAHKWFKGPKAGILFESRLIAGQC